MISCFPISSSPQAIASQFRKSPEPDLVKKSLSTSHCECVFQAGASHHPQDSEKNISGRQKGKSNTIHENVKNFLWPFPYPPRFLSPRAYARFYTILPLVILLSACLTFSGCLRQDHDHPQPIPASQDGAASIANSQAKTFTSGTLYLAGRQNGDSSIYIDVHDAKGRQLTLPRQLEQQAKSEFNIVDNPSRATHILHITILHAGTCNEAEIIKTVKDGFGASSSLSGGGGAALLADALLVKRRVPEDKKERILLLKNVSSRNALESTRMRLGIFTPRPQNSETIRQLEEKLASSINEALTRKT